MQITQRTTHALYTVTWTDTFCRQKALDLLIVILYRSAEDGQSMSAGRGAFGCTGRPLEFENDVIIMLLRAQFTTLLPPISGAHNNCP